jgi:hypothetical protein
MEEDMATRGGKATQEDPGRALPRTKSTSGKKSEVEKADASGTKGAVAKKSNGVGKSAALEAGKVPSQVAVPNRGTGAGRKAAGCARSAAQPAERVQKPAAVRMSKVEESVAVRPDAAVPSPEQKRRMIEVAAYLRAERSGFGTTDPEQDWIEAEREVERVLATRQF